MKNFIILFILFYFVCCTMDSCSEEKEYENCTSHDIELNNYSCYQIVNPTDFAMNHMDLLTGYIDISKYYGVTSPDYRVFTNISEEADGKYYLYIFQLCYKRKICN